MSEIYVGNVDDFNEGRRFVVDIDGREVAVLRSNGKIHAIENTCLHMGGPVGEGIVMGRVCAVLDDRKQLVREEFSDQHQIVCPWHGWAYDLETGAFAGQESWRLRTYEVAERQRGVFVVVD